MASGTLQDLVGPKLRAHFGYRRFAEPTCRVLLVRPHYYLAEEVAAALTARGHTVETVAVPAAPASGSGPGKMSGEFVQQLLMKGAVAKPDFVLTINHHGFDENGQLAALLAELGVPVAAWYVDDPTPILCGRAAGIGTDAGRATALFCWERSFLEPLRAAGFGNVEWLPLAADSRWSARTRAAPGLAERIVFVGSTWTDLVERAATRLDAATRDACDPAILALRDDGRLTHDQLLALAGRLAAAPQGGGLGRSRADADVIAYIQRRASSESRHAVLSRVPQDLLTVVGDTAWKTLLPTAEHRPATDYYQQTAAVYRGAGVVLNVTSRQMPTAANQRVFDVPAAGGFVLNDAQGDVAELFDPSETALYATRDEAAEKAVYYLRNPRERAAITERAAAAVRSRNLYEHRIDVLVDSMRRRFGGS